MTDTIKVTVDRRPVPEEMEAVPVIEKAGL